MTNNKYKILVVEDEENISSLICTMLDASGYHPLCASTCLQACSMYTSHLPDLVLLDLGLPDRDGMEFLGFLRQESSVPVIVLSARSDERDKIAALDLGANDYVTKPFSSGELLARVRSALRISLQNASASYTNKARFALGELLIDYDARRIFIGSAEIKLTQTEYNIVAFLSRHPGKVMTYSSIIKAIWGYSGEGSIKKLQVNMANIRKKLGLKPGENHYIINELGVGYRMNADEE